MMQRGTPAFTICYGRRSGTFERPDRFEYRAMMAGLSAVVNNAT
jgi:hypothetical protein